MTTTAIVLGRELAQDPSRPVFGLAGSGNFQLLSSFVEAGGNYVPAMHEAGAVGMATGWATLSGRVGIASVHQGPGLTNSLTALVDAAKGRTPLVLITASIDSSSHHQWIEQEALLKACGVGIKVTNFSGNEEPSQLLQRVIQESCEQRCTQVFQVPVTMMNSTFEGSWIPPLTSVSKTAAVSESHIQEALTLLQDARYPVIIAGRGAVVSEAGSVLGDIGNALNALLMTTAPAHGLFADSSKSLGLIGEFATTKTSQALKHADVILAVGTSLDYWSTAGNRLVSPSAHVIRVDIDDVAKKHNQLILRGDGRKVSEIIRSRLVSAPLQSSFWEDFLHEFTEETSPVVMVDTSATDKVDPRHFFAALDAALPDRRLVCLDSGHFIAMASVYLRKMSGPHFYFGQDFQSVGLGLFHAIGTSFQPRKRDALNGFTKDQTGHFIRDTELNSEEL